MSALSSLSLCIPEWGEHLGDDKLPWGPGEDARHCCAAGEKQPAEREWALLLTPGLQHLWAIGQHCQRTDSIGPRFWGKELYQNGISKHMFLYNGNPVSLSHNVLCSGDSSKILLRNCHPIYPHHLSIVTFSFT